MPGKSDAKKLNFPRPPSLRLISGLFVGFVARLRVLADWRVVLDDCWTALGSRGVWGCRGMCDVVS